MSDVDDTMPSTERPSVQRTTERRRRSSLRIIVQETRMLFGTLSTTLQGLARNTIMLRRHAHAQNNALTVLNLKLDLLIRNAGLEIPTVVNSEPSVEIGLDEEIENGAADEGR